MVPWTTLKQASENVEPSKIMKGRRKPRGRTDRREKKVTMTTRRVLSPWSESMNLHPSSVTSSSLKILCKAAAVARAQRPRRPLLISRTVEFVSQKDDDGWREPKSKLLYMTALGLTPILHKAGVPFLRCSVARLQLGQSSLDGSRCMIEEEDETRLLPNQISLREESTQPTVTETTCVQSESEIEVVNLTQDIEKDVGNESALRHRFPVLHDLFALLQRIEDRDKTKTMAGCSKSSHLNNLFPCPPKSKSKSNTGKEDDVIFLSQQTADGDVILLT